MEVPMGHSFKLYLRIKIRSWGNRLFIVCFPLIFFFCSRNDCLHIFIVKKNFAVLCSPDFFGEQGLPFILSFFCFFF